MGSAAMSIVTDRHLRNLGFDPVFLSKYPDEDRAFAQKYGIKIQKAPQLLYSFGILPLLVFSKCIPGMSSTLCKKLWGWPVFFYDIGGITFSQERHFSMFLINATWLALPLLTGRPAIKGSQAVGPFGRWYHRAVSVPMLKKTAILHARGSHSLTSLKSRGIPARKTADLAFLLKTESVSGETDPPRDNTITIIPSVIVKEKFDNLNGKNAYVETMVEIIRHLLSLGYRTRLLAHCYRRLNTTISNDYPLCLAIYHQIDHEHLSLVEVFGKTPGQLKQIIGSSGLVITGRFHGMVAALGQGVPVIVTSWSHKYSEVLKDFELDGLALDWRTMTAGKMIDRIEAVLHDLKKLRQKIRDHLPRVQQSALENFQGLDFNG